MYISSVARGRGDPDGGGGPPRRGGEASAHNSGGAAGGVAQAREALEQLKLEANIQRMNVSKAAADLMEYCTAHAQEDPMLTPVPSSENPFREKKFFCSIV
ncbi:guanine nucleotide-binding protein G(I)/G(S)/G(O) subunit gamma-2-like [Lampetra fluviatilis]